MPASRTATCPTCSTPVADSDRFCKNCGTEVSGISISPLTGALNTGTTQLSAASPWELVLDKLRDVTLGEFDVGREIGRGGMAAVFLAHDLTLNRKVAIKVMAPGIMMGEGMVQRFRQEAITIANLSHAHIVTIHAVRQLAELHFFVMQFIEGQSLETVLRSHGTLPLPIVQAILYQVGSGLAYAHRRGVVHRDIKPGNILLSGDGDALVTDFGIAKVAEGPSQTQTGMVVGTPTYMSPEQCYASEIDGASDQYSLGIVAYQMLTGHAPFTGGTFEIMKGHTTEPVPPLRAHVPDLPAKVEDTILRMLAKKPAERFATLGEALAAMGATATGEESPLRAEMIRLASVEERREQLGELLRTPISPVPKSHAGRRAGTDPTPRTPAPTSTIAVAIAPLPPELEPDDEITLRATVRGSADAGALTWSTDTPSVVRVDAKTGVLTALAPGEAHVLARIGDVTERGTLVVTAPRVAAVRVTSPGHELHIGETRRLTAEPVDKRGQPLARPVEWSMVGTAAHIDPDGTVRALTVGRAAVTAACDGAYETVVLHILPARVATMEIVPPGEPLEVGHAVTLGVMMRDAHGTRLVDRAATWSTDRPERARIDAAGVFSALDAGAVRVRAECEGVTAELDLVIPPAPAASVVITNVPELVRSGDRFTLTAMSRDVRGKPVQRPLRWHSTNPDVAGIDTKGGVQVRAAGTADITVTVDGATATARLVAHAMPAAFAGTDAPAASATAVLSAFEPAPAGGSGAGTAVPAPAVPAPSRPVAAQAPVAQTPVAGKRSPWLYAAAALLPVAAAVWFFTRGGDTPATAAPDGAAAVVTAGADAPADAPGAVVSNDPAPASEVPAPVTSDAGAAGGATSAAPVLRLAPPASTTLPVTESLRLRAGAQDPATGRDVPATVRFTSSDRSVATVDDRTGEVKGVRPGRVTITADGGAAGRASVQLTIVAAPAAVVSEQPVVSRPTPDVTPAPAGGSTGGAGAPTGGVAVSPPPAEPPSAPAVSQAQLEREARAVVEQYARAFESRDLARVRAVYPDMPESWASGLSQFFRQARDVQVTLNGIDASGAYNAAPGSRSRLSARVTVRYQDGRREATQPDTWPMTLQREGGAWRLVRVGEP